MENDENGGSVTERYVTIGEVARLLRCHTETVRRMVIRGELAATKTGGKWLIDPDTLPRPTFRPEPPPAPIGQAWR